MPLLMVMFVFTLWIRRKEIGPDNLEFHVYRCRLVIERIALKTGADVVRTWAESPRAQSASRSAVSIYCRVTQQSTVRHNPHHAAQRVLGTLGRHVYHENH